jgi:formylglycine-generating enzyme required for sulfatase activity
MKHAVVYKCYTHENDKGEERFGRSFRNPGFDQDERHPVVCVNWDDARAFAAWLFKKTGHAYRLPSEAEREYVTRAGTTTPFWWGPSITPTQANYAASYTYGPRSFKGEWRKKTVPVDSFKANHWSLYNVHGNVWEWVEDCSHLNYRWAPTDGSAWTTGDCSRRILRGGSWDGGPQELRSARRYSLEPDNRSASTGFRVARSLSP